MKKCIKNALLLTTVTIGTIHVINNFISYTADMKNILSSENGNFYSWKNGKIFYTKRGDGSPILLIHELNPSSSSFEWSKLIKKLEKNHTVYSIDLLGCGQSEKPYITYTNYLFVQLVTDFIKDVITGKPDVIATGESLSFVLLANNMNPSLINKIIGINPVSLSDQQMVSDYPSVIKKKLLETPVIGTFLYNLIMTEKNILKDFKENYYSKPQLVSTRLVDAYYESAHLEKGHGKYLLASMEGNYTDVDITPALKKLEKPIYLIESRERAESVSICDSYVKLNPQIETTLISNTKLLPQLESPDRLSDIINMFL